MPKYLWTRKPDKDERCTCCDRILKSECVMLELDQRDDTYHDRSNVPEANSQGWFPFGKACADRIIANGGKSNRC